MWGWDSGRTRLMADEFGRLGYRVYVPKVFATPEYSKALCVLPTPTADCTPHSDTSS